MSKRRLKGVSKTSYIPIFGFVLFSVLSSLCSVQFLLAIYYHTERICWSI